MTAERNHQVVQKLSPRLELAFLERQFERVAGGVTARNDGNLVDRIGVGQKRSEESVTDFVISGDFFLLFRQNVTAPFGSEHHLLHRPDDVVLTQVAAILAGRQDGGLVHQIGQVGAGKTGRPGGNRFQIDILAERLFAGVNLENFFAVADVGTVQDDAAVEAAGPQESRVQNIGPVGRRHHNHLLVRFKAVHFHQNLIQGLFAFVVAAAKPRTAMAADGVNLVNKNNRRR